MFRRAIPFVGLAAVAAAVVIAVAALTTWWVLLALIPLVMMVGCMAMMAAMPSMDAWRPQGWGAGMMGFDGWLGRRRETPTEILERRFAEGAISVEDYRERREVIAGARRRRGAAGEEDVVGGRESAETPPAEYLRR
jgi:uncharacterized membrane protein